MSEKEEKKLKNNSKYESNGSDIEVKEWKTDHGLIRSRILETEMEESYLDYAMSVIVSRALPDVRDGLKPVHRKILFSMNEMGLTHSAKFRKSATVVGDVMGKYHPHGDIAIYDSLARMAQDFNMRYTLVKGQGNFGSIDGDMPAAMRYTECKLEKISEELLADIDKETVDFIDNFDATRKEPKVLPSKIPNLLINGAMGIAVGMATDIPPHNLEEVCNATIKLINKPNSTIEDLLEDIQGPDFPTGGEIYDFEEIKQAYVTGKGRVLMRGIVEIKEIKKNNKQIIINQIPYRVNKAILIERVAQLVKDKKIQGISDIRDESDKDGIRVVIELKKDTFPQKILNQLYKFTQLQEVFHVNMLALLDGIKPRVLNLKTVLEEFIKHRQTVVYRRTQYELKEAEARLHILEGLKIALSNIDAVISTIKKSANRSSAEKNLINKFKLTEIQANAILEMRLSALAKLERDKIENEYKELLEKIKYLKSVLDNPEKILEIIKEELENIKKKFGDERKTKLIKRSLNILSQEDLIPNERVFVSLTKGNYIKRVSTTAYRSQARGGKGVIGITTKEEDLVTQMLVANNHDDVLFFTNKGRVFANKAYEIMQGSRQSKGQAIVNLLQIASDEKVTAMINISNKDQLKYLLMATKNGLVKKTSLNNFKNVRKSGLIAIRLRKDDSLHWVKPTSGEDQVIIVSKNGQAIRFSEHNCRSMGRAASGVRGIRLRTGDIVVGMEVISHRKETTIEDIDDALNIKKGPSSDLLVVTELGLGKRTPLKSYNIQMRGGIGLRTARITNKTGSIVESRLVSGISSDLVLISQKGQVIREPMTQVKSLGRATSGVRLMRLNANDKVGSVTVIEKEIEENILTEEKEKSDEEDLKTDKPKDLVIKKEKSEKKITKKPKTKKNKKADKNAKKAIKKTAIRKSKKQVKKTKTKKPSKPKISPFKKKSINSLIKTSDKPVFIKKTIDSNPDKPNVAPPKSKDETNYWGADFWRRKKL